MHGYTQPFYNSVQFKPDRNINLATAGFATILRGDESGGPDGFYRRLVEPESGLPDYFDTHHPPVFIYYHMQHHRALHLLLSSKRGV
jgi:hypothetical protein